MARPRRVKRILNVEPSRNTERDWRLEHARDAGVLPTTRAAIPSSKDLREDWWKIGDQGSTGSCVGWATGDSVLRWHFVKAGRMPTDHKVSPRFLWMASKETDPSTSQPTTFIESAGTTLKSALDVARKFGAVRDNVLPFTTQRLYLGQSKTFYAVAAQLRIGAYFNLSDDLDDWRTWLATKWPILTRPRPTRGTWTSTGPRRLAVATRLRSSATRPTASSSATAGVRRPGETRASGMPRSPMPKTRSRRRTGSRSERSRAG
jgi:hypothetical protein